MAKKNPEEVEILGHLFRIEYVYDLKDDGDTLFGDTDVDEKIIKICTKRCITSAQLESTLMHEAIHAVLGVSGMAQLLKGDQEEALVIALEHGLQNLYKRTF